MRLCLIIIILLFLENGFLIQTTVAQSYSFRAGPTPESSFRAGPTPESSFRAGPIPESSAVSS